MGYCGFTVGTVGILCVVLCGYYRVVHGTAGYCWLLLGTGEYWVVLECTGGLIGVLGVLGLLGKNSEYCVVLWSTLGYCKVLLRIAGYCRVLLGTTGY